MNGKAVIVAQGGAGTLSTVKSDGVKSARYEKGIRNAAYAGWKALEAGGSAVDAVEAAVVSMEEDPTFNAGRGSYMTDTGEVEMDASIMDGTNMKAGGVTLVKNILTPVKLSRLVMEKSDHCLLGGEGAKKFAVDNGMQLVDDKELITEKAKIRWNEIKKFVPSVEDEFIKGSKLEELRSNKNQERGHDTVGAVCLDSQGNLAYAMSTGGINAKLSGRIGDSPIVGCGGYADSEIGAVSTTGHGESFMKTNLAVRIILAMESGKSPKEAAADGLNLMARKVGGTGGVIVLNKQGDIGIHFSSEGMSWSYMTSDDKTNIHYGIHHDEHKVMDVKTHEQK